MARTPAPRPFARLALLLAAVAGLLVALVGPASPVQAVTKLTDAQAASQLSASGITRTSSGGCTNRAVGTCTSYDQINQETVSGIKTYKSVSGCAVNISGGTEVGHASGTYSHYNVYKVDISRRAARRRLPAVPGGVRQRVRQRGQPLGHHVLHVWLLTQPLVEEVAQRPSRNPVRDPSVAGGGSAT